MGKDIKTDCSVNTNIDGKTYCFGNEAAKTEFMKDPKGNMTKAQTYYTSSILASRDCHYHGVLAHGRRRSGRRAARLLNSSTWPGGRNGRPADGRMTTRRFHHMPVMGKYG